MKLKRFLKKLSSARARRLQLLRSQRKANQTLRMFEELHEKLLERFSVGSKILFYNVAPCAIKRIDPPSVERRFNYYLDRPVDYAKPTKITLLFESGKTEDVLIFEFVEGIQKAEGGEV